MFINLYDPLKAVTAINLPWSTRLKIKIVTKVLHAIDPIIINLGKIVKTTFSQEMASRFFEILNGFIELLEDSRSFIILYRKKGGTINFVYLRKNKSKFLKISKIKMNGDVLIQKLISAKQDFGYAGCYNSSKFYPCGCKINFSLRATLAKDEKNWHLEPCETCGKYHYFEKESVSYCAYHDELFKKYPSLKKDLIRSGISTYDITQLFYTKTKNGQQIDDYYLDLCEIIATDKKHDSSKFFSLYDLRLLNIQDNKPMPSHNCINLIAESITEPHWAQKILKVFNKEITPKTNKYLEKIVRHNVTKLKIINIGYFIVYVIVVATTIALGLSITTNIATVVKIHTLELLIILFLLLYKKHKKLKKK